jgi:hypothetical protein
MAFLLTCGGITVIKTGVSAQGHRERYRYLDRWGGEPANGVSVLRESVRDSQ